jgi:spore germination cell wall hydrolase CwlJ-like protein
MRKESLLSGGLIVVIAMTLLVSSFEWKQKNKSSVHEEGREYKYEIYYTQSDISDPTPTPTIGVEYITPTVTPTPSTTGESKKKSKPLSGAKDTYKYNFSKSEVEILERITEAEVTGGDIESKKNVVSVIINRLESDEFPDTIEKVVFQKRQFSPIADKRYYEVIITDDTRKAVDEILLNGVVNEALFFCNPNDVKSSKNKKWFLALKYLFTDNSGHSFYK